MTAPPERARPALLARLPDHYFMGVMRATARARALPGTRFLDLARGNPDLPPPPRALEALCSAALDEDGVHGYAPFTGHRALREAIARRYATDHGVALDPDTEVAVVPGTKTGILFVLQAAADAGDRVLLPDPGYPDYVSAAGLAGVAAEGLALEASAAWQPDLDAVAPGRVALTVLNYPANPCAVLARPGTFEGAVAFAHARGGWVLHDLAYGGLVFDGARARSLLEVPGAREVGIELWSPSKVYGMAGWRIGFAVGNAELVARVQTLIDHGTAGVFSGAQAGLRAALEGPQDDVVARRETYAARRDRLVGVLRAAGAEVTAPEGTFYAWWRLPVGLTVEGLVRDARVALAPGEGFGARGVGWARVSLAVADADLEEGAARLAAAVAGAA